MKRKLVLIEWIDACGMSHRWTPISEAAESRPIIIKTVGWIIAEDKQKVVVTGSISDVEHCADGSVIPRCGILKMRRLNDPS